MLSIEPYLQVLLIKTLKEINLMTMNKSDLVDAIASEAGITKVDADKALKAALGAVKKQLASGGKVVLVGFGTFMVSERKARRGKNPRTMEEIMIPAAKRPKLKFSKEVIDAVDS
ncbi:MAG: HU family DNA-binding protein [Pseudomonadota bacterium]